MAVFDGHGSDKIAEFLANNLHQYILKSEYFAYDIPKALKEGNFEYVTISLNLYFNFLFIFMFHF